VSWEQPRYVYHGRVRVWEPASGKLKCTLDVSKGGRAFAAFSPDGRSLATSGHDGKLQRWNASAMLKTQE
jgi:WD40 repeat protein